MTVSKAPKIEPNANEINMAKNKVAHKLELGNLVTTFKELKMSWSFLSFKKESLPQDRRERPSQDPP